MDKVQLMSMVVATVEEGSFTGAARRLGKSKSLISKRISLLEQTLNVRLFNRNTRHMTTTAEGEVYYNRCKALIDDIEQLDQSLNSEPTTLTGTIRVAAPQTLGEWKLMEPIARFHALYPEIEIELVLTDRYSNIIEEGFDVAIRIGALDDSSLVARRIFTFQAITCATPEYLREHPAPQIPSDLSRHNCIIDPNMRESTRWHYTNYISKRNVSMDIDGFLSVNSAQAARNAAINHLGIAHIPEFIIEEDLKAGRLINVLPGYVGQRYPVNLVYPSRKYLTGKVKAFLEFIESNPILR